MNRLLKTMLGVVMCLSSALPAMAEIKVLDNNTDGIIAVRDLDKSFNSIETMTSTDDVQLDMLSDMLGGSSALTFMPEVRCISSIDLTVLTFVFVPMDSFKSKLMNNDKLAIKFADGNTDDFYVMSRLDDGRGYYLVTGIFGALNSEDMEVHRIPMNEEMVRYATSDIESITCGGMTYHIKEHTAPHFKALFAALLNHKGVSKDGFSIYLNSVDAKASSSKAVSEPERKQEPESSTTAPAVPSQSSANSSDDDDNVYLEYPIGYKGRDPFVSPGIYESDFKRYLAQKSYKYSTKQSGQITSLIFDYGSVPYGFDDNPAKFIANFKNQILTSYVYQANAANKDEALSLAKRSISALLENSTIEKSTGYQKDSDSIFSEQYLYRAGVRVTVDVRQVGTEYSVSLMVSITHF